MIAFFIACVPPKTSHHAKKIVRMGGFSRMADKPELVEAKAMLDNLLQPFQPETPLTGAVTLTLTFTWPWLKGHSKRFRGFGPQPHTSRPDCSNLAKTIEDRLVKLLFLQDDNAVADLRVRKFWGDKPGIAVEIRPLVMDLNAQMEAATLPLERIS